MYENQSSKFQGELNSGERIIWSGQPQQGFLLRSSDIIMIPFSVMWGGFAIFWESSVISEDPQSFFVLWGIPFVLVGLYMMFGRFLFDRMQRSKTYYALTNERVIIISGLINQNTKTLDIKNIPEINISTKGNGRGTITFGASSPMGWVNSGSNFLNMGRNNLAPCFEMIDDVQTVYQQVKRLQREET